MVIRKMHIDRRTVLRGLGASIALPFLDSMVPALTAQSRTAAARVRRLGVFYVPNGMSMPYWSPKTEGPLAELPPTLRSLAKFKQNVLMCGGLDSKAASLVKGGGDHARAAGTFLTCLPFKLTTGADVEASVSFDQLGARELGKETQLASLELGLEANYMLGACDTGASCVYTNTIAWRTPTTPLPPENDPRALFERLFGTTGSTDPRIKLSRMRRDRSILDVVMGELGDLGRVIGPGDRVKLDEYVEAVRDVERRITLAEKQNSKELPLVEQPLGVPNDYSQHAKLMMDLLALAYQSDLTRISTFMLGREISNRAYPEIGISDSHHPLSHHQDKPINLEKLYKINEYQFQQFTYLVEKLAGLPEGDGSVLDSSVLFYGASISDSNTHFHSDLPVALVAGKATGIKGDRYVVNPKGTPIANLYITLLDKLGVHVDKFGDATGLLQNLGDQMVSNL